MSENVSLEVTLDALKKIPAWGLVRTHGSMFFLEIGQPRPKPDKKKVHGEWHFLIEMCHWRIEKRDMLIVGSEDDQELIDCEFASLELGQLEEGNSSAPSYDLHLVFSSGMQLRTFSASAAKTDWTQWMLFCPDDNVWVAKAGSVPVHKSIHSSE